MDNEKNIQRWRLILGNDSQERLTRLNGGASILSSEMDLLFIIAQITAVLAEALALAANPPIRRSAAGWAMYAAYLIKNWSPSFKTMP